MKTRVVICGSFHRQPQLLERSFKELEALGCRILSPITLNFSNPSEAVVHTPTDEDLSIYDLEAYHLRAMRDADFVWLHSPDGHVGLSGAFELGYAEALKKPVFCFTRPNDEMLSTRVWAVQSIFEALQLCGFE